MKKTIAVTEFKAHCLALLEAVSRGGSELVVTKRGRPLARISPIREQKSLRGTVSIHAQTSELFSTGEAWEQA